MSVFSEFETDTPEVAPKAASGEFVIRTFGLNKLYGGRAALSDVNVNVRRGDIYGFIGNNGAGKSTLIRIITGLAAPSSGKIELFGDSTPAGLIQARRKIGAVIEVPSLYNNMTARENLVMRLLLLGVKPDYNKLLDTVGLPAVGKKPVKNYSLGMKQRLGIAMAIMGEPELLVLDEPINGLDPAGIYEVREIFSDLNKRLGTTLFISSHILGELAKIATAYGIIAQGRLVKELTADSLREMSTQSARIIVDDIEKAQAVLAELGITRYKIGPNNAIFVSERTSELPYINQALNKNGVLVLQSELITADLESYFMRLMGGTHNGQNA